MASGILVEHADMFEGLQGLTDREREVLALMAEGRTNLEIAEALCISICTAKNHVHNLLDKLGVKNRVQAAVLLGLGATFLLPGALATSQISRHHRRWRTATAPIKYTRAN